MRQAKSTVVTLNSFTSVIVWSEFFMEEFELVVAEEYKLNIEWNT